MNDTLFDLDPDDLDPDDLERLGDLSDEDLAELYEDPGPEDPLAGYARPAVAAPRIASAVGRDIRDLPAL